MNDKTLVERLRRTRPRNAHYKDDSRELINPDGAEAATRIEALEARLEIDPSQPYDGIYTRDETIRLLDTRIEELKDANKKAALDLLAALGQSTELMDRVRVLEDTINKIQLRTTSHPDDTPDDDKRDKGIANMLARHVMKND